MNKMKSVVKIAVGVAAAAFLLAGCSRPQKSEEGKSAQNSEDSAFRTIVDHNGVEVKIPAKINRIVIGSILPLPSVYCMYMGSADKLVGMHPSSMAAAKNSYLVNVFPDIANVDTSFVKGGVVSVEELLALKPDVVLYSATNEQERQIYETAGIPAIGFSTTRKKFNCVETYADWIDLLGKVFGDTGRSDKIIEYGRKIEKDVLSKTAGLSEEAKPKVLVLFNYDSAGGIKTSGSNFFGQYWIETSGGINVAKDLKGQAAINMEQIYEWNPDMIFITNFSPYLPEDLLGNKIDGYDWSNVKAVKERKVYKYPLGMYRWFPPASDTPLCLEWMAKKIQPELFADIDMDKEIVDFYKQFYGVELTARDVEAIYNPARAASGK